MNQFSECLYDMKLILAKCICIICIRHLVGEPFLFWVQSVSINEFLKPAESERHNGSVGRGRGGRGRGPRGGFSGGGGNMSYNIAAPAIDDVGQFPSLAAK